MKPTKYEWIQCKQTQKRTLSLMFRMPCHSVYFVVTNDLIFACFSIRLRTLVFRCRYLCAARSNHRGKKAKMRTNFDFFPSCFCSFLMRIFFSIIYVTSECKRCHNTVNVYAKGDCLSYFQFVFYSFFLAPSLSLSLSCSFFMLIKSSQVKSLSYLMFVTILIACSRLMLRSCPRGSGKYGVL